MSVNAVARLSLLILFLSSTECQCKRHETLASLGVPKIYAPTNSSLKTECDDQVKIYVDSLQKLEPWALEMFDASSKIPLGFFTENIKDLGMYDQCINVNVSQGNKTIRGQHCMYSLDVTFNRTKPSLTPTLSVCFPATCKSEQVKEKMQELVNVAGEFLSGNKVKVISVTCSEVDDGPWEFGAIVTLGVFGALLTFLLICTFCDVFIRLTNINSSLLNTIDKFSLIYNAESILRLKGSKENILVAAGLKFYGIWWIILGHRIFLIGYGSVLNISDKDEWIQSWGAVVMFTAMCCVDTFLVVTGFLTSYLFLQEMAKGRKFNLFTYYLHRYIRLTPAYMALLAIAIFLLPKMGSGAMWQRAINTQSDHCRAYWWAKPLYIHNYVHKGGMSCLPHTWYLAVDMQLFWVSPLIIYPLSKKPKLGLTILGAAIVGSVVTPAILEAINQHELFFEPSEFSNGETLMNYYILTYNRAGPWLLGVLLGYLLATDKRVPSFKLKLLGWTLTILGFGYSMYTFRIYQNKNYQFNVYFETFNGGFGRHIWALGICWIIYVSTLGHGGLLSRFLSLPIYLPFSRISYSIYLLHYVIQTVEVYSARAPIYLTEFDGITYFIHDLVIMSLSGFFFSLVFESPFVALEKLIFSKNPEINQKTA